jgi:CCR4-NOT transcription complex subunit 7/8
MYECIDSVISLQLLKNNLACYSSQKYIPLFNKIKSEDMYAQESIDLLAKSGIMFQKNTENGIDPMHFAELLTSSGVVICDKVTWISFHSSYDFGYLIKLLTNKDLPNTEAEFLELLKIFFPNVFDIKYLMKSCRNLKGGLEEVARQLEVNFKLFV